MKLFLVALMTFLSSPSVEAEQRKCCEERNVLARTSCINGKNISLECDSRYIMPAAEVREMFKVEENGSLVGEEESLAVNDYCVTRRNDSEEEMYIMCYYETKEAVFRDMKIKIGAFLGYVSVFFIILTIVVYLMVPKLFDLQGICIVHSLSGLGIGYFFLGLLQLNYLQPFCCALFAFITYTAFLYAFFWLNVLSFHIWRIIVKPDILKFTRKWFLIYHIFGIGGTVLCLLVLLVAQYSQIPEFESVWPGIADHSCWFTSLTETFIYFYGPISVLLCLNVLYYVWTVVTIWIFFSVSDEKKAKVLKCRLILCIKLFFIMGITWIFEVLSAVFNDRSAGYAILWVIMDTLNALQGLLIFLILVVFRTRARKGLANRKFFYTRFPASWKNAQDEEMDEIEEEEISLSAVPKV